jgi:Skp family chaperone for outer membrane proteins
MQKRAHKKTEEVMLVPFLDILCSLIGVLVLIIVVLCVAQMQKINAVDPEDVKRAIEAQKIKKQMAKDLEMQSEAVQLQKKLEEQKKELQKKKDEFDEITKLRRLADASAASAELNKIEEVKLAKILDDLMIETEGLKKEQPPLQSQIAALEKKIAELKIPDDPVPKVIIQRPSSGIESGAHLYFIECSGKTIRYYMDPKNKRQLVNSPETIVGDAEFNAFLKTVKRDTNGLLCLMLRNDGWPAYENVVGWAKEEHGFDDHAISKMAVPGRGDIDLSTFGLVMGKVKEFDLKRNIDAALGKPEAEKPAEPKKP